MIVANLATFPPRAAGLMAVVRRLAPQVDRLNIVFNQYDTIPEEYRTIAAVNPIIPTEDTKDVGKFYPDVSGAAYVFYVDDDVDYPDDFVAGTIAKFEAVPLPRILAGYHTSLYRRPALKPSLRSLRSLAVFSLQKRKIARYRQVNGLAHAVAHACVVDQVATNAAIIRGRDAPDYAYMRDSQKFVDVRLARWCFEHDITPVCLPRPANWMSSKPDDDSIFRTFTSAHHDHVAAEIWSYAFKVKQRGREFPGTG